MRTGVKPRVRSAAVEVKKVVDESSGTGQALKALIEAKTGKTFLHGTVTKGNTTQGWFVRWDFAAADDPTHQHSRKDLTTLEKGTQEPEGLDDVEEEWDALPVEGQTVTGVEGLNSLTFDQVRSIETVKLWHEDRGKHGTNNPEAFMEWTVHKADDHPTLGDTPSPFQEEGQLTDKADDRLGDTPSPFQEEGQLTDEVDFGADVLVTFFKHFFPDLTGHGKKMDAFLSNPKANMHGACRKLKKDVSRFSFEQKEPGVDPDSMVRMGWALLTAGATELAGGVTNLLKTGAGPGRKNNAAFGRYMCRDAFQCWKSAAPCVWAKPSEWHLDADLKTWDILQPHVDSCNCKRSKLFGDHGVTSITVDETIVAWRPKTHPTGHLPDITHCPRKPKDLGTELRDAIHNCWGVTLHLQIVMQPSTMQRLPHFGESSSLPNSTTIGVATSEVLRTCKATMGDCRSLPADAAHRWVVGDAWFGSVMTVVELTKRLDVRGSFVVKGGTKMFPKKQLLTIPKARYEHPAGHWVTLSATIAGVKMMAIAHAWSSRGVSLWITTVGDSGNPSLHTTHYTNEVGETECKVIPRPDILAKAYAKLPLIDERNRLRQDELDICKSWPTEDCWFRLQTGLLGMCVTDYYSAFSKARPLEAKDFMHPLQFADVMLKNIGSLHSKQTTKRHAGFDGGAALGHEPLCKLRKIDGDREWVTAYKKNNTVQQKPCQICKFCHQGFVFTTHACPRCNMPLCKTDMTIHDDQRSQTCHEEHIQTERAGLNCKEVMHAGTWTLKEDQASSARRVKPPTSRS